MGRVIDLTGQKYGRLLVLERAENNSHNKAMWLCKCDCGNVVKVIGSHLRNGNTSSCGCLHKEMLREKPSGRTHGMTDTRLFRIWGSMLTRCYNKNHKYYHRYGGRGITVCEEWLHSFQAFYDWAMSHGYADDLTLDRKDVNGNYCPENCKWSTQKEQMNNTSTNHLVTCNGETHTIAEWAAIKGINYYTLHSRLTTKGWPIEKALTTIPSAKYAHK